MTSASELRTAYGGSEIAHGDQGLVHAVERVVDAGQTLTVRRIDLLIEELRAHSFRLLTYAIGAFAGVALGLAGYCVALVGLIDWLDDYFARAAVEIVLGVMHVATGAAVIWLGRRRAEQAPS